MSLPQRGGCVQMIVYFFGGPLDVITIPTTSQDSSRIAEIINRWSNRIFDLYDNI